MRNEAYIKSKYSSWIDNMNGQIENALKSESDDSILDRAEFNEFFKKHAGLI